MAEAGTAGPGPAERRRCDLIVANARLLTADPERPEIGRGALAVADGRILAVGEEGDVFSGFLAAEMLDAGGGLVHPGFIDAHIHITQYAARSVLPLMEGTAVTMGDWKGALRPEDEQASALLAALDLIKCGYTGFVEPGTVVEPEAVAAAARAAGMRAWLSDAYVGDRVRYLAERIPAFFSASFMTRWTRDHHEALSRLGGQLFRNRDPEALVRGFLCLYGEGSDSLELHAAALGLARAEGVPLHKHLGYSPAVYADLERDLGGPPIEVLDAAGLLGPELTLVHMNRLRERDLEILAERGVRLVWCPSGQLAAIGGGGARGRMASAHRAGIPVGIASDIARGFNFDGLGALAFGCAKAAGDPVEPREIFLMRTRGAAAAIGAEAELGSLAPGKRADLVVRRPGCAEDIGFDHALELAVAGGRDSVAHVFVAGRAVLRHGRPVTLDEAAIVAEAHRSARDLAARIGLA